MFLNAKSTIMKTSALKFIRKLLTDWTSIRVKFHDKMLSEIALSEEWDLNKDKRSS